MPEEKVLINISVVLPGMPKDRKVCRVSSYTHILLNWIIIALIICVSKLLTKQTINEPTRREWFWV